MSDVDPTPATPVTIGDRLSWFRGDVAAQLNAVSGKLDTVIARLDSLVAGGNLDSAPIVAAIEAMRGSSPNNTLETLNTSLLKSNTAQGADPDDSLQLTTVRGLLYLIYLAVAQVGIPPDSMDGSTTNSGSLSIEGTRYIVWPDIDGLTRSVNGVELTPNDSWNGYEIYIQTSAPSARMHNISGSTIIDPYPVNSWVTVDGNVTYAWSVDASFQVVGYMRVPAVPEPITLYDNTTSVSGSGGPRITVDIPANILWVAIDCDTTPNQLNLYLTQNGTAVAPIYPMTGGLVSVNRSTLGGGWAVNVGDTASGTVQLYLRVIGHYTQFPE